MFLVMEASKWADAAYFPSRFNEYQGCDDVVVVGETLLFFDDGQSLTCLTLVFSRSWVQQVSKDRGNQYSGLVLHQEAYGF